jgi:predicted amidohydrolase
MRPFSIAGVQMYVSATGDNVSRMKQRLDVAMHLYPWIEMVLFSELCPYGPYVERAQPMPGPIEDFFREMAQKHEVWLIPGTLYERAGERVYNTASVIDPKGEVIGRYRKMFPFTPYEVGVDPGDEFFVFDIPDVGRFALSICYDMWFPETIRTVVSMGAEVILHPSLTNTIDREVELAIARANAAMHQCYILDVNGLGDGGNGGSIFVGPSGDVLHVAGTAEEVIPLEIDLDRVRRSRDRGLLGLGQPLKSFRDRKVRFDVYGEGFASDYLSSLGPLEKPMREKRGKTK